MKKLFIIFVGAPLMFFMWSGISYWFLLFSMSVEDARGMRWFTGGLITLAMLWTTLNEDDDKK